MNAERLKTAIRERGLTYGELSRRMGINISSLTRKRRGQSGITLKDYKKAIEIFGEQTAAEIFLDEGER